MQLQHTVLADGKVLQKIRVFDETIFADFPKQLKFKMRQAARIPFDAKDTSHSHWMENNTIRTVALTTAVTTNDS